MNARERLELSHWRRETYRTLRDAGIDDRFADRVDRIGAAVGWVILVVGFIALWIGG